MQITTLRPGLLVSLKTSISGNVTYNRYDIEADHIAPDGTKRARWETERAIEDPDEHEKAVLVRSKCRSLILSVCSPSNFGLLCPESRKNDLDLAIMAARQLAEAYNQNAKVSRIDVFVITGRVEQNDVEAVRAINSDVRDLLLNMESGIKKLDVKMVRDAANKARLLGQMLSESANERVKVAIDAARNVAKKIVKAGDEAAAEVDQATLRLLRQSRSSFLDIEDGDLEIAAPKAAGRAIDLVPDHDGEAPKRERIKLPELEA